MLARLSRLIDRTQIYHETASYLGPERNALGALDRQVRRLEIFRSAVSGVSVMRDEMRAG